MSNKYMLDTCAAVFIANDVNRFGPKTVKILETSKLFVSVVSLWELKLKYQLGKYESNPVAVIDFLNAADISIAPLGAEFFYQVCPPRKLRDPFDDMIVSVADWHDVPLITSDEKIMRHASNIIDLRE